MIAGRGQELITAPIYQRMERTFGPAEKLFDHDAPTGFAESRPIHHPVDGRSSGSSIRSDDDPFAEREAVSFDDDWIAHTFAVPERVLAGNKTSAAAVRISALRISCLAKIFEDSRRGC